MLRHKALIDVLGQANSAEVTGALLFNREGVLLAYSGYGEGNASVSAALVSSIWEVFDKKAGREELKEALLECDEGCVAAARIPGTGMLLALKATHNVKIGLLRAKLRAVAEYLNEPLTLVSKNTP